MRFLKLILIAALVSPVTVLGQGAKIAVINVDTAVSGSAAGKAAIAERQAFFEERNAELQATQVELTRLQTELQTRERVLAPARAFGERSGDGSRSLPPERDKQVRA